MQSRYMGGGCTKEVEPMCNHEHSQTHQIEAYQQSEICAWPQISFFTCTLVTLQQEFQHGQGTETHVNIKVTPGRQPGSEVWDQTRFVY